MSVNPYVSRVGNFPGKLFPLKDFQAERSRLIEICGLFKKSFLEIGSGSGNHLVARAENQSEAAFFGIEQRFKRAVRTIEKAENRHLRNVFVIRSNAHLLDRLFPHQTFDGVYINFPDPWEKRRTAKHRILTNEFLQKLIPLMKDSAFVSVKTDDSERFEEFMATCSHVEIEQETKDLARSDFAAEDIRSEFQDLFYSKQILVCHALLRVKKAKQ